MPILITDDKEGKRERLFHVPPILQLPDLRIRFDPERARHRLRAKTDSQSAPDGISAPRAHCRSP
jgi:hypothetical protein